jgi:hypothetical protein
MVDVGIAVFLLQIDAIAPAALGIDGPAVANGVAVGCLET